MIKLPCEPVVVTATVAVEVTEPEELVAVSVYVVVAVGCTVVEPLAEVELKPPGEIEMVVAPLVAQFKALLKPEFMLVGLATNDEMDGADPPLEVELDELVFVELDELAVLPAWPQPLTATHIKRTRVGKYRQGFKERRCSGPNPML